MSQSRATRRFAVAVTLFIALAAAALSYDHALIVSRRVGTEPPFAYLVPLLPDGLIVLAFAAMQDAAQARAPRPAWATLGLSLGVVVTLVLNVASGWHHGWGGRLLNALPPVALLVAIEVLVGILRRGREAVNRTLIPDGAGDGEPAEPVPVHVALARLGEEYGQRQLAAAVGVSRAHVQRHWPRPDKAGAPDATRTRKLRSQSFADGAPSPGHTAPDSSPAPGASALARATARAGLNGSGGA